MNAHRIDILHIADRDHIPGAVPHYLILDFLPSGDAALHKDLSYPGKAQAVFQDFRALLRVFSDPAAGAAQGIGGTQHHRIADPLRHSQTGLYILYDFGRSHRFPDLLHRLLKHFPVFGLLDGEGRGSDKADVVLRQDAGLLQFHGKV